MPCYQMTPVRRPFRPVDGIITRGGQLRSCKERGRSRGGRSGRPTFRIKVSVGCCDTLEALSRFSNRTVNAEIEGLPLEHKSITASREHKIGVFGTEQQHFLSLTGAALRS